MGNWVSYYFWKTSGVEGKGELRNSKKDLTNIKKEGFCIGSSRVNFGVWYTPIGKTPQQCTYCEFCISNGCISRDEVYQLKEEVKNCNCDCPNRGNHPHIKKIECPTCQIKRAELRCASCGICSNCQVQTPYIGQTYCTGCSWILEACHECGDKIKDGDIYIEEAKKITDERINELKLMAYDNREKEYMNNYTLEGIKTCNEKYEKLKEKYEGKKSDEILNMLKGN